jgi:hypothetical protein
MVPSVTGAVNEEMQFIERERISFLRYPKPEILLEFMFRHRVIAFLLDASYSAEFGLVMK